MKGTPMDDNKPISGEFAAMLPVISQTMQFAVQAIQQSMALASVLIAKGVLTQEELNKAVAANSQPTKMLQELLGRFDKKPD
jgi:hypothetical protein